MPRRTAPEIPVVDIAGLDADAPDRAIEAIAAQIRAACLGTGFFYLSGHGIAEDLIAGVFAANRWFHDLPLDEKLKIKMNVWHRGYQPLASSTLTSSARFAPAPSANQLESFFLRHEVSPDDPAYQVKELMGPNQWPEDPAFRAAVGRYDAAVRALGLKLLPAFSMAVGERPDFFRRFFDPPFTTLRLIHYPRTPKRRPSDLFGIHPHTDYGFLTILAQDEVGGLEVQRVDGGWIEAPPVPGTLILNIGDVLARWTNEVFNSTPHRVLNRSHRRSRYSVGLFFDPNLDAMINCLDGFADQARPAGQAPIRYGDYFRMRLDSNFPDRVGVARAS